MKRENLDLEPRREEPDLELNMDAIPDAGADGEYSLEEILFEFSGNRERAADEKQEEHEDYLSDEDGILQDGAFPEIPEAPEVKETSQSSQVPAEQSALPEVVAEEPAPEKETPASAAEAGVPDAAPVAAYSQVTNEEPREEINSDEAEEPVQRRMRSARRRRIKVVEEFPDDPADVPAAEPVSGEEPDYAALFRMFADPDPVQQQPKDHSGHTEPENFDSDPAGSDGKPAHEPLLAENPLDFRDILREFMLGDQHPIYADMPGIGKKTAAGSRVENNGLDDLLREIIKTDDPQEQKPKAEKPKASAVQPADEAPQKHTRPESTGRAGRKYEVEEDFPIDLESLTSDEAPEQTEPEPDDGRWMLAGTEAPMSAEEASQPEQEPEPEEEPGPEPAARGSGIRNLLRGFADRERRGAGKRALNEPKAFASFEDYVSREEAKPEEPPEHVTPTEPAGEDTETTGQEPAVLTEEAQDEEILYSGDFPSFGQWILNELMTLWIRLNGIGDRESTATMEDDSEDLGKEVNVANASRYYGSQVTMLRMRFQIGMVLLAILAYITLGLPVSGMLKTAKVASAMCLGLQMTIMLLCLDIVTNAAVNLVRRKFGADALAVLACIVSSFDALSVAVGGFGNPHIPLCLFSSLALMGVLFSALLSSRALRKSTRVPAIGKRVYCVTAEEGVRGGGDLTLLKSVRPTAGFVRRAEEAPPDESLFSRSALIQLLAAVLLSLLTAIVKHSMGDYLYILSALLSCAVPVTALLAFALPYFIGSERIFSSGAAVAGWSGIHDIGCSRNLIVTDRDLFPEDTVSIETVRIFADDSAERVIGFAGTMIAAAGSGLAPCFAELMEKNNCRMRQVEDFQWLSGGGLQGRIEGSTVLCGSSDLMQLMNVRVPYRLVDRTTVLLAIDGVLYGIFKINYTGLPEIRSALQELIASNRHPIFAIRDFNITPEMLHEVFDVATDGYDFPPFGDRFRISEAKPSETSKVSAVICREGLGPLTHLADTGRSMYVAIRLNLMITAFVAVFGMLAVFLKLIGSGEVSAWFPFVLMLLDAIVVALVSLFMRF